MKRLVFIAAAAAIVPLVAHQAHAGDAAPRCTVCNMKVDAERNVQYRYVLAGGEEIPIGSLTCAKTYWEEHTDQKMEFEATDFVSGVWENAESGHFVIGSKLRFGTGMDETSVLFFADQKMAEKARRANGGRIVPLTAAVKHAAGSHEHHRDH